jgi:CheY-like chemotaxis protein
LELSLGRNPRGFAVPGNSGGFAAMNIQKKRILVVDDEPFNISLLRDAFSDSYDVFDVLSPRHALAAASSARPDLILLDVVMPGMDGFEVCRLFKEDASLREIPVIFITGLNDFASEARGLDLGAVDFITKPFHLPVVTLRVRNQLDLKVSADMLRHRTVELEDAFANIKILKGMLPICSCCKKIRDDQGYWQQLEQYLYDHTEANFSHGVCPECLDSHYGLQV